MRWFQNYGKHFQLTTFFHNPIEKWIVKTYPIEEEEA